MKLSTIQVKKETPTIFSVHFKPETKINFRPGQYLLVELPVTDPKGNDRSFSIASSPTEGSIIIATRQTNSIFKKKFESLKKGELVEAKGPYGSFTLDESKPAIMLSGGIGITPLRCMMKYATDKKLATKITLFYANRNPEEIAFKKDLDEWQKANKNLKIIYTVSEGNEKWNGLIGYVDEKMIKANSKISKNTLFYICGPPAMVDAMVNLLKSMKIDDTRIRIEHFTGY